MHKKQTAKTTYIISLFPISCKPKTVKCKNAHKTTIKYLFNLIETEKTLHDYA